MEVEDVSDNPRVNSLSRLSWQLQQSRTPVETMRVIRQCLADAYGHVGSMMLATRGLPAGSYQIVQLNLDDAAIRDDDLSAAETVYQGGPISDIISVPMPRLIHEVKWDADPIYQDLLAVYGSVAAIPLLTRRLPMTWVLLLKRLPERFTAEDLEEGILRVALVGSLLESQSMAGELEIANDRVDQEVRQAAELQRMLLPSPLPDIPCLEMAVSYEPSGRAGGDLFDLFLLDEGTDRPQRWCVLMADASGHGLAAAVVMAIIQSIVRAHPPGIAGPGAMLEHVNRHLCRKKLGGFVTAFVLIYEPESRKWSYASAGHPPPLVKRGKTGAMSKLEAAAGIPLGIDPSISYAETRAELCTGDTFLLYTDGITEARNRNADMFEVNGVEKLLRESTESPSGIVDQLRQLVTEHQQGQPAADDQTVLVVRVG